NVGAQLYLTSTTTGHACERVPSVDTSRTGDAAHAGCTRRIVSKSVEPLVASGGSNSKVKQLRVPRSAASSNAATDHAGTARSAMPGRGVNVRPATRLRMTTGSFGTTAT